MKKILRMNMYVFLILLCCSGCGLRLVSPENLVQAPQSNQAQLQQKQEIMSFLNRDEYLIFSETGGQGAVYQMADLDLDGEDEIVAFFNNRDNSFQMGFLILDKVNGVYQLRNKETLYGRGIHTYSLTDLDQNGSMELLIGIRTGYGSQKELCLYQMTSDNVVDVTEREHLAYDQLKLVKNNNGGNEIVLATMETTAVTGTSNITVYHYENLLLSPIYGNTFEGYCNEISYGNIASNRFGIGLLLRGNHTIRAVMLEESHGSYQPVLNQVLPMDYEDLNNQLLYRDVNQDGILEIVSIITPEDNSSGKSASDFLQIWSQWDGVAGSKVVGAVLDNQTDGFRLQVPTEWLDEFYYSFRSDGEGQWLDFYLLDKTNSFVRAFSLGVIDQHNWTNSPIQGAFVLGNNPQKNKVYVVEITKEPLKNVEIDVSRLISCLQIEGRE